jgi:MFS transporter, PHS family, inorganic phosphate transporter
MLWVKHGHELSNDITWRILLALGAIPGLAVFYLRRQIHETPRFAMAGGAAEEAEAAIAHAPGTSAGPKAAEESVARPTQGALEGFKILARNRRMLRWLIGTAGA